MHFITLKLFQSVSVLSDLLCACRQPGVKAHTWKKERKKGGGSEGELVPHQALSIRTDTLFLSLTWKCVPFVTSQRELGFRRGGTAVGASSASVTRCVAVKQHVRAGASKFKAEKTQKESERLRKDLSLSLYLILIIWRVFFLAIKKIILRS